MKFRNHPHKFILGSLIFGIISLLSCQKRYAHETGGLTLPSDSSRVVAGKDLTMNLCGPCHYSHETAKLSGKRMLDIPDIVGKVYASNITNDSVDGIAAYSPAELRFLLKTGIKRDGRFSPYMVKPNLADEDLAAIITFLKSKDPLVDPASIRQKKSKYTPAGKIAVNHVFKPEPFSDKPILRPGKEDTVALGKYLVDIIGCYECHSANFLKIDKRHPENSKGYLAGGNKVKGASGKIIRIPNITFDKETGIGDWSEAEFTRALKEGITKSNRPLAYPMPVYSHLSYEEAASIYKYIKSLPPAKQRVAKKKPETPKNQNIVAIYDKYSCSACHGKEGKGIADLTKAAYKYSDNEIITFIKNPPKSVQMPSFDGLIKEEEFPMLVAYIKELSKKAGAVN